MPIKECTRSGITKLICKANGVDCTVDDWKVAPEDMLTLNPHSDQPTKSKDQMIYIQQRSHGVMFVDSYKLLA